MQVNKVVCIRLRMKSKTPPTKLQFYCKSVMNEE
uniref:Uncharacterized protein n=1 Tax=Arundo donax TaxID=35708 RepID=A0A0A9H078_ARUDO